MKPRSAFHDPRALLRLLLCLVLSGAASAGLGGCALLGKSAPITPRYFTPERGETSDPVAAPATGPRLRLGRISAGPNLRERIAYRTSDSEVGYYMEKRWTERPDAYLKRSLARTLFERDGLVRSVSGAAPTLDAELVAFEELKTEPHRVRGEVFVTVDDGAAGVLERTFRVEREVQGDDMDAVVKAFGQALDALVEDIARAVSARLRELPSAGSSDLASTPLPPTPASGAP